MITFPLREAMCSGVMPFWKGRNRNQLGCGIFLSNAAALHPTPLSTPRPQPYSGSNARSHFQPTARTLLT